MSGLLPPDSRAEQVKYGDLVRACLARGGLRVLHAGCGRDKAEITYPYRNTCEIIGIDLDGQAGARFHSTFILGSVETMGALFPSDHFHVICCENVIEHLDNPRAAFSEFARVLKPGGRLLVQTPNLLSYKAQAARIVPQSVHLALGRRRYGVGQPEMYSTLYRCNTGRALVRAAAAAGMAPVTLIYQNNGATWLRDAPVLGSMLEAWHRALDWPALAWARCRIVAEFQKTRVTQA